MNESEECRSELVVAGCDTSELLQLVEEAFDVVALAIDGFLPAEPLFSVGFIGDVGNCTLSSDVSTNAIGIVALVGDDDGARLESVEQGLGARHIVVLAGRDDQADRAAFRIDARVDFRGEAAPASAHTTISTLFFTPEAC